MHKLIKVAPICFPQEGFSDDCKDLLNKLCCKQHADRLGSHDVDDILSHKWFSDLTLLDLQYKHTEAPYKPVLEEENEFQY